MTHDRTPRAHGGAAVVDVLEADVVVVGAGPAGLAAAVTAAEAGLYVAVVDSAIQPGGQYWRHPDEQAPRDDESQGHHDWQTFTQLRDRFTTLRRRGVFTTSPARRSGSSSARPLQVLPISYGSTASATSPAPGRSHPGARPLGCAVPGRL